MSRRDLAHVMAALARLGGPAPDAVVAVSAIDDAVGRGRGDMRTPLDLAALSDRGHVVEQAEGGWSLTPAGREWLAEQDELSTQ